MSFNTVRFCHLDRIYLKKGDIIRFEDSIGKMGNTGKSFGYHLHIDCIEGVHPEVWRQEDTDVVWDYRELNYFIDEDLFQCGYRITTPICDADYMNKYGILHHAYDLYPTCSNYDIFWNRSRVGRVISEGYDRGYGNYVNVSF